LLAGLCPRFKILGISTVHGNSSLENTTRNTLSVLEAIGRRDVPVYPGVAKPFCREAVHAPSIHGRRASVQIIYSQSLILMHPATQENRA
jgi:uridine nucleosidase